MIIWLKLNIDYTDSESRDFLYFLRLYIQLYVIPQEQEQDEKSFCPGVLKDQQVVRQV